jgi:hypothetical protein
MTALRVFLLAALLLALAPGDPESWQVSRERMQADLEFLCSPALGGRASLSPGAEAAARFIAAQMRAIGLQPATGDGFLQPFGLVPTRLDRARSAIRVVRDGTEPVFAPAAVFFPDPDRTIDLTLDVVFAGYGITAPEVRYDDYAGLDVRGKAVLVFDHEPQEDNPHSAFNGTGFTLHANTWSKTRNAQRHGAAAVLVVTEPINSHRTAPRAPDRANAPSQALASSELRIPRFSVPAEAAAALFEGSGRGAAERQAQIDAAASPASAPLRGVKVRLQAANEPAAPGTSWNVAGLLPGTDSKLRQETVLVTSHYDHLGVQGGKLYPGANDNASGVAGMLEVARLLARQPPRRSVLFVAFGSEEQLMLGSYYYVAHPLRPLETTVGVLNLDMIGRDEAHTPESLGAYELTASRPDQLNLVGAVYSPRLQSVLEREAPAAGLTLSTKFDRDSSMRALFRCDHLPFLQKGVPAVWLFGGFHPGYHEPVDTVDKLDFEKLTRAVRLTAATVSGLPDPPADAR